MMITVMITLTTMTMEVMWFCDDDENGDDDDRDENDENGDDDDDDGNANDIIM